MAAVPEHRLTTDQSGRHHLASVADAFLSSPAADEAVRAPLDQPPLFTAAPGTSDTASVLAVLRQNSELGEGPDADRDLGGAIGVCLVRLERGGALARPAAPPPLLIWCPRGREGLSLVAALALGRLGALLQPSHLTVLWFPGPGRAVDRDPDLEQCRRASRLARAAIPTAAVAVHCLGWTEDAQTQLADLARRFS